MPFSQGSGRGSHVGAGKGTVASVTLDSLTLGCGVDYVKFDVEGAERRAIEGARETLTRDQPDLRVALYHRPGDIFDLILLVRAILPDHRLYIRRAPSFPCWDVDLLAIKNDHDKQ